MIAYSTESIKKLLTCEKDLQVLFNEVIKYFDNTILYGNRALDLQMELFLKGRLKLDNKYLIIDKKKIVTYCDGVVNKSNHNYIPSRAVDALPYPINGKDYKRIYYFAGFVMALAKRLKAENVITHDIKWGGD